MAAVRGFSYVFNDIHKLLLVGCGGLGCSGGSEGYCSHDVGSALGQVKKHTQ